MSWQRSAASVVHRHIWQRLPHGLRRQALLHASSRLAPRPDPHARTVQPVFVAGYFRTASGLGESARLCAEACHALGYDTRTVDISAEHMQPTDLPHDAVADARSHLGPGTVILHVNAPLVPLALLQLGRAFVRSKHIIGTWAWELERVPPDWRRGLPFVHQAWAPSRFTAEAVRQKASALAIRVVPHPLAVRARPVAAGSRDRFRVLMIFNAASSFARKNPCAGIAAFRRAFGADANAELVVKSSNLDVYPGARAALKTAIGGQSNIRHIDHVLPPHEIEALYEFAGAVLSLHRSEGFGLVLAEAMLRGLPVVATNWSGNVDFLDADNGCPVRYGLVPARDPRGVYDFPDLRWAEPDIDHAAEYLRRLSSDPDWRTRIGRRAAEDAARIFSLEAYGAVMNELVGRPSPH